MCEHGATTWVDINGERILIDKCMVPLIEVLNPGIPTVGCCCGHGKAPGWIHLEDDRYLILAPHVQFVSNKYEIWDLIKEGGERLNG